MRIIEGSIGMMEKKMEITIWGVRVLGPQGLGFS